MSDEILIKEHWAKSGISEHWVRIEDYGALEEKLRECEQERMQAACDRNIAQYSLAIAISELEKIASLSMSQFICVGDMAIESKNVANEALEKIRTSNEGQK